MNKGALRGITVIDLSDGLAGAFCAQTLADHGADVIKIELPHGDQTRLWGPPFEAGTAAYFNGLNRNKQGMALDLTKHAGQHILKILLADADVLIENQQRIDEFTEWGIGDPASFVQQYPKLIHCRLSDFGDEGPLGGFLGQESVIQAMVGIQGLRYESNKASLYSEWPLIEIVSGLNASIGVLLALQARQKEGLGQKIEATLYDSGVSLLHPYSANYLATQRSLGLTKKQDVAPLYDVVLNDVYETKKGLINLSIGNNAQFIKLCAFLDVQYLVQDMRFADHSRRMRHRKALKEALVDVLKRHDGPKLSLQLLKLGVPCGPVCSVGEALKQPHLHYRKMVVKMGEEYTGIASPIKLSQNPASYRLKPPSFGQDSVAILKRHGYDDETIESLLAEGIIYEAV